MATRREETLKTKHPFHSNPYAINPFEAAAILTNLIGVEPANYTEEARKKGNPLDLNPYYERQESEVGRELLGWSWRDRFQSTWYNFSYI